MWNWREVSHTHNIIVFNVLTHVQWLLLLTGPGLPYWVILSKIANVSTNKHCPIYRIRSVLALLYRDPLPHYFVVVNGIWGTLERSNLYYSKIKHTTFFELRKLEYSLQPCLKLYWGYRLSQSVSLSPPPGGVQPSECCVQLSHQSEDLHRWADPNRVCHWAL